jgi:hypothetical protein
MADKKLPIELFICDCHSTDHQMIFIHEYEEEAIKDENDKYVLDEKGNVTYTKKYPMCYAHVHLVSHSFWSRVKYGIKYIFGYKSRYGAFDEFIFNPEDAPRLQKLVDHLNEQV